MINKNKTQKYTKLILFSLKSKFVQKKMRIEIMLYYRKISKSSNLS